MNIVFLNLDIMEALRATKKGFVKDNVLHLINKNTYKIFPAVYITEAIMSDGNIDLKGFVLTEEELEDRGYELYEENLVAEASVFKVIRGFKGYLSSGKGLKNMGIKDTIERLIEEHVILLEIAGKISNTFSSEVCDCENINKLLHEFIETLTAHLKTEDLYLYPSYYKKDNLKFIAEKYSSEMKNITKVVLDYFNYWDKNLSQHNFSNFIVETKGLFTTLVGRIDKEENDLFKHFQ